MKSLKDTKTLVFTALFAALVCAATMSVRIPTPGTNGYIHPGDALVILSGVFLGPLCGFLAAGIGSALSDLAGGYFLYVPATLIIKGLVALLTGMVFEHYAGKSSRRYIAVAIGGIIDIVLVAGGYGIYESFIYGVPAALASVPANVVQGVSGLIIATVLFPALFACKKNLLSTSR